MRALLLVLLVFFTVEKSFSQSLSEADIKELAENINTDNQGIINDDSLGFKGCISKERILIYQYTVPEKWGPHVYEVDRIIERFKEEGHADFFYTYNLDLHYHYYNKDSIVHKVMVSSEDFAPIKYELGEYLSLKDHPKSKQVNLKIKVPSGWEVKEGDLPSAVKQFINNRNTYVIAISENLTFYSRKQASEIFQDKEYVTNWLNELYTWLENAEILENAITKIDTYPALEYKVKGKVKQVGVNETMIIRGWVVYYEDKIVMLSAIGFNKYIFDELEPLYFAVTGTLIFPDQYK